MDVKKKKINIRWSQLISHLILIILVILVCMPLYFLIIKSFKDPNQDVISPFRLTFPLFFTNYELAWLIVKDFLINTLVIAVLQTTGVIVVCSVAAYGFTRYNFPYKRTIFISILALMMIPGTLTLIPRFQLVINVFRMKNTFSGVVLPAISASIPIGIYLLTTFFKGIDKELFEAAEIDGANRFQQFLIIAVPLSIPILSTLGLMTFMSAWNDLLWPRLILQEESLHTISIGLVPFTESYYEVVGSFGVPFAGYVIVSLPLIILFLFTSKQFIKGLTSGAFKL